MLKAGEAAALAALPSIRGWFPEPSRPRLSVLTPIGQSGD